MKPKIFTLEEVVQMAADYRSGATLEAIRRKYQARHDHIKRMLTEQGIVLRTISEAARLFTPDEKNQIVADYLAGQSIFTLVKEYQSSDESIKRILSEGGVVFRNHSEACRKHKINEDFLDVIDTEIKAYWLGFMFADGYNGEGKRSYNVTLGLQHRDRHILETFAQAFESERPIYISRHLTVFSITSKKLSLRLAELGCHRAKTFTLTFPEWMPHNLLAHFMRGYIDGDGWISVKGKGFEVKPYCTVGATGNAVFMARFAEVLQAECGCGTYRYKLPKSEGIVSLAIAGRDQACTVLAWLYKDATVYLERKKRKAEQALVPLVTQGGHRGIEHHMTTLTEEQVLAIKQQILTGEGFPALAREYGVTNTCIKNIAKGKSWGHLTGWNRRKNAAPGIRKGGSHYNAKLTDDQVREIKQLIQQGEKNVVIAAEFSVPRSHISNIRIGKIWKHIDPQITSDNRQRSTPLTGATIHTSPTGARYYCNSKDRKIYL